LSQPDPSEFVRLLMQHQNALLKFILPLVGCMSDAQDVLQETATALWKKFEQYDAEQPFLPWAKQFARNEVLMYRRKSRRYTFLSEELIESLTEVQVKKDGTDQERSTALQSCLRKLPQEDRDLLKTRYSEEGTTIQEVAELTGKTANVLYKNLGRIRKLLLGCINQTLAADS
jgi:RNA polymerase sigma-70 factor (ECF subfamily)